MRKHHRASRLAKAGVVPATAAAIVAAGTSVAWAAPVELPSQGGVSTPAPSTQGGTTSAPKPAPAPPAKQIYWTPPPAQQREYAPLPDYNYDTNRYERQSTPPPIDPLELRAPQPVTPEPIYIAPPEKIMIGDFHFNQPNWVTDDDRERTNNTAGLIRSDVATFYKSIGVDASRADRVAAAQIGGAFAGGVAGAAAGAVPGALIGGTIGGIAGAAAGGVLPLPIPVLPEITTGVAGTAAGAAIGAAVGAVPGAVVGGAVGLAAGTAFGAGDDEGQPIEVELPDVHQDVLTEQSETTVTQWDSAGPVEQAAADAVRSAVQTAPQVDSQVREWVQVQPGGEGVIAGVDNGLEAFFDGSAGTAAEMISTAIGDGTLPA
ncbi:insoluble domain protein [Rhodococcus chondri]|uniref:Insoluble domain protein n=1 Tax=Rhodococcus chondri TaxID=3065941 RepID=A0ABU7K0W6_9NOCA|nr:insoluble domain protein [Rhodococcus sp. CC-R104]MEE2035474.1 insoluble domain protein [Rhodococcus sp. CC-R104]